MFVSANKVILIMVELNLKDLDDLRAGKEIKIQTKNEEDLDYTVVVEAYCSNPERK